MQSVAHVIIKPKLWNICINDKTNTLLEYIVLIVLLCVYKGLYLTMLQEILM